MTMSESQSRLSISLEAIATAVGIPLNDAGLDLSSTPLEEPTTAIRDTVQDPLGQELGRLLSFRRPSHPETEAYPGSSKASTAPSEAWTRSTDASTAPSDAFTAFSEASPRPPDAYRKIGAGACGAVFACPGPHTLAIKFAKAPDRTELWDDYVAHTAILEAFQRVQFTEVKIPQCHFFVPGSDTSFFEPQQNPGLVETASPVCNFPTHALVTERIPPLSAEGRRCLIGKYCAPRGVERARSDPANEDCLVRVYLGSMNGRAGGQFFSLRNFKLHLNQMVELGLGVEAIARRVGAALGVIHWGAKQDGRDIEFVLGNSATVKSSGRSSDDVSKLAPFTYTGPESRKIDDFFHQPSTELWVLDFNQVQPITLGDEGVAQAVFAVQLNDPYFPRPLRESAIERGVWKAFVLSYLHASLAVLQRQERVGDNVLALPRKFILGLINLERGKKLTLSPD